VRNGLADHELFEPGKCTSLDRFILRTRHPPRQRMRSIRILNS
jgi:hypothetical protein